VPMGLMVTAHFDDPVIWAGGIVKRTRDVGWDWTVVVFCAAEPQRRACLEAWCESLGAHPVSLRFVDHPDGGPFSRNAQDALRTDLLRVTQRASFDWVLTHSLDPQGEYGPHPNHTEAARIVATMAERGELPRDRIAHFAYRRIYGAAGPTVAALEAVQVVQLDYEELRWKAEWCAKARDVELRDASLHGRSWLERLSWPCPNPEAFTGQAPKGMRLSPVR
jgi:LmbE family N-acetylglucosaminyl deacetylase